MAEVILKSDDFYNKRDTLREIKVDSVNWLVFYIDDSNNEKWVEEYPFPDMHGGGPPQLRLIPNFPWEASRE